MRQREVQLLERNYDGFLQKGKGRLRGIKEGAGVAGVIESCQKTIPIVWVVLAVLLVIGVIAWRLK